MTALLWCLVVIAFLPFALGVVGNLMRKRQFGYLDNKTPRAQQSQLQGIALRALGAQQNAWEALAMFTAVVVVVQLAAADPVKAGLTGIAFVVVRLLHAMFYLANLDILRSLSFGVGIACLIRLVVLAA